MIYTYLMNMCRNYTENILVLCNKVTLDYIIVTLVMKLLVNCINYKMFIYVYGIYTICLCLYSINLYI